MRARPQTLLAIAGVPLVLLAAGCGKRVCQRDTDCRMPDICVVGVCTSLFDADAATDAGGDARLDAADAGDRPTEGTDGRAERTDAPDADDLDAPAEPAEGDDAPADASLDGEARDGEARDGGDAAERLDAPERTDAADVAADRRDAADLDVRAEDARRDELPAGAVVFADDFDDGDADGWLTGAGTWGVAAQAYGQTAIAPFAEAWTGLAPWSPGTRSFLSVDARADSVDGAAPKAVVGALVRAQSIDPNKYYLCGLDFKQNKVILVAYDQAVPPGYRTLCEQALSGTVLTQDRYYTLQVEADGGDLRCRVVGPSGDPLAEVAAGDAGYADGAVGLYTFKASGTFDNVSLSTERPAGWTSPPTVTTCP